MNKKLLRKKLALMLATLKKKRKYYCECEFLQSSGTQYIDLGITSKSSMRAKAKFNLANVSAQAVFGSANAISNGVGVFFGTASNGVVYCNNTSNTISPSLTLVANTNYEFDMSGTSVVVNGTTYTASTTSNNNYNMLLFARTLAGNVDRRISGKIYYFKLYDNGILIRDMIPVLDWNMTPCMYDKVTEQLFYNQGTGDFTAGREIHPVEYLESTGEQRIDTGYIPNQNTTIEFNIQLTSTSTNWAMITGRRSVIGTDTFFYMQFTNSQYFSNSALWFVFGPQANTTALAYPNPLNEHIITISVPEQKIIVDGNTTSFTGSIQSGNNYPLNVFSSLNASGSVSTGQPLKLYYYKIWDNDTLVRDFIPMVDEQGVGAMFDRVTHTCYLNQGTGVFSYPAREVEYLESSGTQYIDTGLTIPEVTRAEITVMPTVSGTDWIFGAYRNGYYDFSCAQSTENVIVADIGVSRGAIDVGTGRVNSNVESYNNKIKVVIDRADGSLTVNDVLQGNTTTYTDTPTDYPLYLGARYNPTGSPGILTGRLYGCKIHNGTDLVRDFIPCYKDGQAGMWDKVNNVFYPNAGTGTFTTSKIIEPEYE